MSAVLASSAFPLYATRRPEQPARPTPVARGWIEVRLREASCSIAADDSKALADVRAVLSSEPGRPRGERVSELLDSSYGVSATQTGYQVVYMWVLNDEGVFVRQCFLIETFTIAAGHEGEVVVVVHEPMNET